MKRIRKYVLFALLNFVAAAATNQHQLKETSTVTTRQFRGTSSGTVEKHRAARRVLPGSQKSSTENPDAGKDAALTNSFGNRRARYSQKNRKLPRDASETKILDHLLVVISFSWNIQKLVCLDRALSIIQHYRTNVDVIVVSDFPKRVQRVLEKWDFGGLNVTAWTRTSLDASDDNKYALLWLHRDVFSHAMSTGSHSAFLYLEDDTKISWRTMVSWACDTEALAPFGFQRGIYRTEISPSTGEFVLMDVVAAYNISNPPFPIVRTPRAVCSPGADVVGHRAHASYVQLTNPFQGMWLATRTQLIAFMKSPYWEKKDALGYNKKSELEEKFSKVPGIMLPRTQWGYPERSNGMNLLVDVPYGYMTNNLVPFSTGRGHSAQYVLSPSARVEHIRNGYSGTSSPHSKLPEDGIFVV